MPEDRKISIEDFRKLLQEKHDQVEEIKEIFRKSLERNERNRELKLASKLNKIIETEPTQKGKDFLLAIILMFRTDGHPCDGCMNNMD